MAAWLALAGVPVGLLLCCRLLRRANAAPARFRRPVVIETGPGISWTEVAGLTGPQAEGLLDLLERCGVAERELGPVGPAGFVVRYRGAARQNTVRRRSLPL